MSVLIESWSVWNFWLLNEKSHEIFTLKMEYENLYFFPSFLFIFLFLHAQTELVKIKKREKITRKIQKQETTRVPVVILYIL